jgi:hypothetical protein
VEQQQWKGKHAFRNSNNLSQPISPSANTATIDTFRSSLLYLLSSLCVAGSFGAWGGPVTTKENNLVFFPYSCSVSTVFCWYSCTYCYGSALVSMRIQIQHFRSIRSRTPNADPDSADQHQCGSGSIPLVVRGPQHRLEFLKNCWATNTTWTEVELRLWPWLLCSNRSSS